MFVKHILMMSVSATEFDFCSFVFEIRRKLVLKYFHIDSTELESGTLLNLKNWIKCNQMQESFVNVFCTHSIGSLVMKRSLTYLFFVAAGAFLLHVQQRVQPGQLRCKDYQPVLLNDSFCNFYAMFQFDIFLFSNVYISLVG